MGGHGLCILLLISFVFLTSSFNLNSNYSRALHKPTREKSSFGYSISFHQENGKTWLLVGAPLSDTAYKCDLAGDITCSQLNILAAKDSWLGATVVSGHGSVLVCAPRSGKFLEGDCYYAAGGSRTFQSLNSWIVNDEGKRYCNIGFSASISAEQILIGGPSCDNNGNMFRINRLRLSALNRISSTSSSYFTYATTMGRTFNNNEGLVTSTVFRPSTIGEVNLVDIGSGTITRSIKGKQQGEFYGNSMTVTDVDGNRLEDLLVGAPHYTDYDDPSIKYEVGRVYIYHQEQQNGAFSFDSTPTRTLEGRAGGGRFGHAIAALGDVNGDGFNDVAISAPYEDHGNVYIYFGSASGLRSEPGQVISGNQFSLRAFGFSLAGNVDVDGNGYADLAVGAYQSDAIVYLPARPVIRTALNVIFEPTQISLEDKLCLKNGQSVSCSKMTSCLSYADPRLPSSIEFKVSIVLDFRQSKDARLLFHDTSNMNNSFMATVTRGKIKCSEHQVYIRPDTTDKLSPMDTQMTIQVISHRPFNAELPPVLDFYTQNSITRSITIANNCGPDNICIPDLDLEITMENSVLVQGARQYPEVRISIRNKGESAFEASFNMRLPDTLLFRESKGVPCSTPGVENEPSVKCDIGNPLESDVLIEFTVFLEPNLNIMSQNDSVSFSCEATSKNQEIDTTLHDNRATLELQLAAITFLTLNSRPVELLFNRTFYELSGKNETALPQFSQEYEIFNNGPSTILGANVTIYFASQLRGANITHLESLQVSEDQGTCQRNDEEMEGIIVIRCQIQRLAGARRVVLSISGHLTEAVYDDNENDTMAVMSNFTAAVTRLPFGLDPLQIKVANGEATLRITRSKSAPVEYKIEWWYYLASALGAALLLAAISGVLYKLGFFTRNRPPTSTNDTAELHDKKAEEAEEEET